MFKFIPLSTGQLKFVSLKNSPFEFCLGYYISASKQSIFKLSIPHSIPGLWVNEKRIWRSDAQQPRYSQGQISKEDIFIKTCFRKWLFPLNGMFCLSRKSNKMQYAILQLYWYIADTNFSFPACFNLLPLPFPVNICCTQI